MNFVITVLFKTVIFEAINDNDMQLSTQRIWIMEESTEFVFETPLITKISLHFSSATYKLSSIMIIYILNVAQFYFFCQYWLWCWIRWDVWLHVASNYMHFWNCFPFVWINYAPKSKIKISPLNLLLLKLEQWMLFEICYFLYRLGESDHLIGLQLLQSILYNLACCHIA